MFRLAAHGSSRGKHSSSSRSEETGVITRNTGTEAKWTVNVGQHKVWQFGDACWLQEPARMHVVSVPRPRLHDSKLQPTRATSFPLASVSAPASRLAVPWVLLRAALRCAALSCVRSLQTVAHRLSVTNCPLTCQF